MSHALETPWHGVETANHAALAFVNTLDWRGREEPTELVVSFEELLRFAHSAGRLTGEEARALQAWGRAHPRLAERARRHAIEVREAMARIFRAAIDGGRPDEDAVRLLDETVRAAREARGLRATGASFVWAWRAVDPEPDRPIRSVALAAAELVTSPSLSRVRACADAECGWMFLDVSKNGRRRWCSMESCGNRNKARSFYRRAAAGSGKKGTR